MYCLSNINVCDKCNIDRNKVIIYLHENHKEKAQVHRQVQQVPNQFQVKGIDSLFFPLSFHEHVTNIENIFYKC